MKKIYAFVIAAVFAVSVMPAVMAADAAQSSAKGITADEGAAPANDKKIEKKAKKTKKAKKAEKKETAATAPAESTK